MALCTPPLVVDPDAPEDRYSRLRLIPWWDQEKLRRARVMVVGAGALGNELLKSLALLGVGHVLIVDLDRIENSNLSRSVLYRAEDEGEFKAEVAARRVREINPDVQAKAVVGNVITDIGLGVFRAMDVVLGGLDNREARVAINQSCWRTGTPWVDGAIEVLIGVARVFVPPDGPCYECTMGETDYRLLNLRKSCTLLSRGEMLAGKVPTTPTTASVIAGIQVQEAVKLIHRRQDLPTLSGRGFVYNGLTYDSYVVTYARRNDCPAHDSFGEVLTTPLSAHETTLGQALSLARELLGRDAVLEFSRELVTGFTCERCGTSARRIDQLGRLTESDARCPGCGGMRRPEFTHSIQGNEPYLDMTLKDAGIPPFDILTARDGLKMVHFELGGDREEALGGAG